ncbi:bacteriophage holin [Actinophytocola oryzae]|uniref:Uncharacterized protein n=1 Tax=Actinophytocola oryzae TaxID=502181 RepID=A0A4R7V5Y2_9PSEU|nr:hypothetical protein CLV71_113147 [Actinophytocola oryzae]
MLKRLNPSPDKHPIVTRPPTTPRKSAGARMLRPNQLRSTPPTRSTFRPHTSASTAANRSPTPRARPTTYLGSARSVRFGSARSVRLPVLACFGRLRPSDPPAPAPRSPTANLPEPSSPNLWRPTRAPLRRPLRLPRCLPASVCRLAPHRPRFGPSPLRENAHRRGQRRPRPAYQSMYDPCEVDGRASYLHLTPTTVENVMSYLPALILVVVGFSVLVVVLVRVRRHVRAFNRAADDLMSHFGHESGTLKARLAAVQVAIRETRARVKRTPAAVPSNSRGRQEEDRG